jgi:hypothetical protein
MGLLTWWFIFTELEQIVVWRFATVIYCKRIFHGNAFFFWIFLSPQEPLVFGGEAFLASGRERQNLKEVKAGGWTIWDS